MHDNRKTKGQLTQELEDLRRRIAELEKSETERKRAEERLAFAQRAAGAGIWDWDMTTEKLEWSPELFLLLGLDPATAVASFETWRGVLHPEDREAAENRTSAAVRDHERLEVEYRFVLPSGEIRWINAVGNTTYAADGRPLSMAGICLDVTSRQEAEEELKKSQERLRALSARIQSVREEERANISREIHDDLGQLLTGLKLDLAWLLRRLNPDQSEIKKKAQAMGQLIDQTVQTVRRISTELRPRILDDFGLAAALEWQAREFATRTGIACRFRSTVQKLDLKTDLSVAVFRIFQEALTNVARHARATRVGASLKEDSKGLVLTIRDNGRGISQEEIDRPRSLGLVGIRERALILGGTVAIQGKKGKGTSVILHLPATGL